MTLLVEATRDEIVEELSKRYEYLLLCTCRDETGKDDTGKEEITTDFVGGRATAIGLAVIARDELSAACRSHREIIDPAPEED